MPIDMKGRVIKLNVMSNSNIEDECKAMSTDLSSVMQDCSVMKSKDCKKVTVQKSKNYLTRVMEMGPEALHVKPCLNLISGPWNG